MNSTDETTGPAASRPRRPRLRVATVAGLAVAGLAAVAGCQSSPSASGPSASAVTPPPSATAPATSAATPVLGRLVGIFARGTGFGQARPAEIYNGGDPTGLVTKISWPSWGGATATGTGTSTYVAANQPVAAGTQQSATIVAFDLGTCDGKLMYQAVEWYFPQHGQSFSPNHYENVCAGTYVPAA